MTVHVDQLSTEVAIESGRTPQPSSPPQRTPAWAERDKLRKMRDAMRRDCARTWPEGFDA